MMKNKFNGGKLQDSNEIQDGEKKALFNGQTKNLKKLFPKLAACVLLVIFTVFTAFALPLNGRAVGKNKPMVKPMALSELSFNSNDDPGPGYGPVEDPFHLDENVSYKPYVVAGEMFMLRDGCDPEHLYSTDFRSQKEYKRFLKRIFGEDQPKADNALNNQ